MSSAVVACCSGSVQRFFLLPASVQLICYFFDDNSAQQATHGHPYLTLPLAIYLREVIKSLYSEDQVKNDITSLSVFRYQKMLRSWAVSICCPLILL